MPLLTVSVANDAGDMPWAPSAPEMLTSEKLEEMWSVPESAAATAEMQAAERRTAMNSDALMLIESRLKHWSRLDNIFLKRIAGPPPEFVALHILSLRHPWYL